jgi:hypothetical protein
VHLYGRIRLSISKDLSMSNVVFDLNASLAHLRTLLAHLREIVACADQYQLQFLPPLLTKESDLQDDDSKERVLNFTGEEFHPQSVTLKDRLADLWGFSTPPHRLTNSLPRYLGHIAIPHEDRLRALNLIQKINAEKKRFSSLADQLHTESGFKDKRYRVTDTLIHYEIIEDTHNAELISRPILCTQDHQVHGVSNRWVSKPAQPKVALPFKETLDYIDANTHGHLILAIKRFEAAYPGSKYAIRYESPPNPEIRYQYVVPKEINVRGIALKRLANSSPLLVLHWDKHTAFKTKLNKLDVRYDPVTNVISVIKDKVKPTEPKRLLSTENWYGFPPKDTAL